MKFLLKPLQLVLAMFGVFLATSANALVIQISDTPDFTGTVISANDYLTDSGVVFIGDGGYFGESTFADWTMSVTTGVSGPAVGDQYVDILDLNSINVSGGTGTLYIRLTDIGFSRLNSHYSTAVGGTTSGTVSFQSYLHYSNLEFGDGSDADNLLLSDSGLYGPGSFSSDDSGEINVTGPYSLSIYATVTHTAAGQVTSFDYAISIPEPATIGLLGIGLLGIGLARRKKTKLATKQ